MPYGSPHGDICRAVCQIAVNTFVYVIAGSSATQNMQPDNTSPITVYVARDGANAEIVPVAKQSKFFSQKHRQDMNRDINDRGGCYTRGCGDEGTLYVHAGVGMR
jgi:hypothetical protein